ncbi:MAG: hypothetical protein VB034_02460 [Eubacteriales bacterium]|nr:hypothetical protein [Eubacteriales bacterium]
MSRPQKTWTNRDFEQFEALCKIQCSKADICAVMDVSEKTLDRLVKEQYRQTFEEMQSHFRAYGKASLLRIQFKLAERNPTMAIWLGKQYLGQQDPSMRRPPGGGDNGSSKVDQFLDEADQR